MRRLFVILSLFVAIVAMAGPVDKKQAMQEAAAFLKDHPLTVNNKADGQAQTAESVRLTDVSATLPMGEKVPFYIINIGDQQGFVIVSGDDRTNPILGYSDEGAFDANRMPANMRYWLDCYAQQLNVLAEMDDMQAARVLRAPRRDRVGTHNSIAPLITTKWDQATPYWNELPDFVTDFSVDPETGDTIVATEKPYSGCVATSMSQIMYFYKQPQSIDQEIPSYTFTVAGEQMGEYATVTMEAQPPTTFDWEHMRETYTGAEQEVYTSAVAHLMLYVGCSVKMQYGLSASGAYTDDIPKGFKQFGYGSKIAFRNDYDQESWNDLVYDELAAGRPMIYNGTAGSGGGHSFICDGFEYGDYFHINWGWGGMGNGFFQLSILNPSASGIGGSSSSEGYNMKQNIIYNIIPGTATPEGEEEDPEEVEPILTVTNISGPTAWDRDRLSDPFKIYKSKIVKVSFSDHSETGKKFKEALALYDPEADTYTILPNSETWNYATVTTSANGETKKIGDGIASNASNVIKFGAGLTGIYRIVPMYQVEGSSEWKPMKESDRYYIEVNMTSTTCTPTYHPNIDLTVTNWSFTGDLKVGSKVQVNATIKNNSEDRFFDDIYLDFGSQKIDDMSNYTTVVQAEILAGQESVVTFNVSPQSAGTQAVTAKLVEKQYGDFYDLSKSGSVTIAESQETEMNLTVDIEAVNAVENDDENTHGSIYDSSARFKATITNHSEGEYNKYVLAPLFIVKRNEDGTIGSGSMVTYKQQTVSIPAGGSVTYYFDFDNLAYGSTYSMNIYARNNVPQEEEGSHVENIVEKGKSKYYEIERGVITWKGDGTRKGYKPEEGFAIPEDVAAVSLEGLTLKNIAANSNPNTLYFLGEGETAPTGLEGRNVVVGTQASAIALEDGYDFYTPQTFTASEISYERTFTQGHNNKVRSGWSTIVLPFQPTKVTNQTDGKQIDWFRSSADSGKQFWLCDFAEEDGQTVFFRNAPEMQANVPYLVAVPDNAWGAKWNLVGKKIVWSATNATVKPDAIAYTSGQNMVFAGSSYKQQLRGILGINADGSQFSTSGAQSVDAFHAYFKAIGETPYYSKTLDIAILNDETNGIEAYPQSISEGSGAVATAIYDLSGRRVATLRSSGVETLRSSGVETLRSSDVETLRSSGVSTSQLPKGIYIINGKKVVIK